MKNGVIWRMGVACSAALVLLAGCGGGSGSDASLQKAALPLLVEGRVQPGTVDQGISQVKSRAGLELAVAPTRVTLGPLAETRTSSPVGGIGPRQVGVAREVPATKSAQQTQQQLRWSRAADGGLVAAVSFQAEGAYGLRLGVVARTLPHGTVLRVYSAANSATVFQISGQEVLQNIARNASAGDHSLDGQTWWTPDIGASEVTLEVQVPFGTDPQTVDLSVPRVSHIFEDLSLPSEEDLSVKINESAACQLDGTCYEEYASQRNAVARMVFTSGGGTYVCTGTLLNDLSASGTPYFLTANHCISTQAEASSLQTDWFYRSPVCNSRTLSATTAKRVNGAALLYASASTDTSFLRLNDTPPAGAVFAGWDASSQAFGAPIVGLHHPRGDLLKASFGSLASQTSCVAVGGTSFQCSGSSGNFYRVSWTQGTTEGGSSGSALFKNGYVIGTLYGGSSTCAAIASPDFYSRFDVAFNAAIKDWLAADKPPSGGTSGRVPVYRFYNLAGLEHFYTSNVGERDLLMKQYASTFVYEGVIFYTYPVQGADLFPLYRMVDSARKIHLYTASPVERDAQLQRFPSMSVEGTAWWGRAAPGNGAMPVYRFFNRQTGGYFYTTSAAERTHINANLTQQYLEEGIGFYVWADK